MVAVVHASLQDIEASYEGKAGGGCLPYGRRTAEKQPWLQGNMCRCLTLTEGLTPTLTLTLAFTLTPTLTFTLTLTLTSPGGPPRPPTGPGRPHISRRTPSTR